MNLLRGPSGLVRLIRQIIISCQSSTQLIPLFTGLILGWWVYVPIHELLHAAGCVVSGGYISRLELSPIYGGELFSRLFPFISSGGKYAGRLTGFVTHGSDMTYGVTIYLPYLLSLPAFACLQLAVSRGNRFMFGFLLPCAIAPLLGLTGDFYELGSLILFQAWPGQAESNRLLISDDLFRILKPAVLGNAGAGLNPHRLCFVLAAFAVGAALAWQTLNLADILRKAFSESKHCSV